jgi:hypothetical protein
VVHEGEVKEGGEAAPEAPAEEAPAEDAAPSA